MHLVEDCMQFGWRQGMVIIQIEVNKLDPLRFCKLDE